MKKCIKYLFVILLILPIFIKATTDYKGAVSRANNYTNEEAFSSKNKYLKYGQGTPYNYSKQTVGSETSYTVQTDSSFKNGGLINKEDFELTLKNGSSYLLSGSPYWTMTKKSTNEVYTIGKYNVSSESITSRLDTRVTQYVKPNVSVNGSGEYSNPWYFVAGYNVKVTTNNKNYAMFVIDGVEGTTYEKNVEAGQNVELDVKVANGYKYSGRDECNLKKSASSNTKYMITNIRNDINCIAYFNERVFKFTLASEVYATKPEPEEIYYKYNTGWYKKYDSSLDKIEEKITKITPPTRIGYNFKGYKYNGVTVIDSAGNISNIPTEKMIFNSDNQELTAEWEAKSDTRYTVKHNQENCDGTYTLKDTETLQGVTDTKVTPNRKTYTGFTSPNGEEIKINADGSAVLNYNYTRDKHTVSVAKGTGINSVSGNGTYKYGCNYTLNASVKDGYTWKNYTGSSTISEQSKTLAMGTSDLSYTANATGNTYYVKYNGNTSTSGSMSDSTHTYGTASQLTANAFSKTGYTFQGWSTTSNGSVEYADKASVSTLTTSGTKELYAIWKANTYYVKYNGNTSTSGSMSNSTHTYGTESQLTANAFSKTGYTFQGWSTTSTGSVQYANKASVSTLATSGTKDLYAIWKGNTYYVKYNKNDSSATGTMSNSTHTYGTASNLTANAFSKTGYTFQGWSTTSTGSVQYADKASISTLTTSGTKELYAVWKKKTVLCKRTVKTCSTGNENENGCWLCDAYSVASSPRQTKTTKTCLRQSANTYTKETKKCRKSGNRWYWLTSTSYNQSSCTVGSPPGTCSGKTGNSSYTYVSNCTLNYTYYWGPTSSTSVSSCSTSGSVSTCNAGNVGKQNIVCGDVSYCDSGYTYKTGYGKCCPNSSSYLAMNDHRYCCKRVEYEETVETQEMESCTGEWTPAN